MCVLRIFGGASIQLQESSKAEEHVRRITPEHREICRRFLIYFL